MKYLLIILVMLSMTSYAQEYGNNRHESSSILNDNKSSKGIHKLDDIEGVWQLNVTRTFISKGKKYVQHEDNYSEWLIIDNGCGRYVVKGKKVTPDGVKFSAHFTKIDNDEYHYYCSFYELKWKVSVRAFMSDGNTIRYGYYADKAYLKKVYGKKYRRNMSLHWIFTWVKIYPKTIRS